MDFNNRIRHFFTNSNGHPPVPHNPHEPVEKPVPPEPIQKPRPVPHPSTSPMPGTSLEEKQALLAHHVRLVACQMSNGLFVVGPGGLGKSRTISTTLIDEGICPVLVNSHITPLSLYRTMYFNKRDAVIWLDDCDSIYGNLQILGLLRSALWGQEAGRIVTYNSTQLEDIPSSFTFDSRIVFCANQIPKRSKAFEAVLSRVDVFELDATNEELMELMRSLANQGFESLAPAKCHEVLDFIQKWGGTRRLSMRLYEPSLKKYEYAMAAGVDWRDLVRCQLDQLGIGENTPKPLDTKAHDVTCLREAMKRFPNSVKEQQDFWSKATGKSRASFFRLKTDHGNEKGE